MTNVSDDPDHNTEVIKDFQNAVVARCEHQGLVLEGNDDRCEKVEVFYTIQNNFDDIKRHIFYQLCKSYLFTILPMLVQSLFLQCWCFCFNNWCPNQTQSFVESVTTFSIYWIVRVCGLSVIIIVLLVMRLRTGLLVEYQAVFAGLSNAVVAGYFFWISPSYTISLITFVEMVYGMIGACVYYISDAVIISTTDYHLLITTSSGKYLPLMCYQKCDCESGGSCGTWKLQVVYECDETRKQYYNREQVIRSDICRPGITISTFHEWIVDDYMIRIKNVENPSSQHFVRACFDYLAKTKSYNRAQNFIRSPGFDVGGINWAGKLMFINERDEKSIIALKDYENEFISKIRVYKVPLSGKFLTNLVLFHSFAVICIETEGTLTWWSCEKNTKYIVLQKNPDISMVRDYIEGDKRCENWYWKAPQLICEETVDQIPMKDIVDICEEEMRITYQGITDNCQRFTDKLFNKCTGKCLEYGFIQRIVSKVTHQLASKLENSMVTYVTLRVRDFFIRHLSTNVDD